MKKIAYQLVFSFLLYIVIFLPVAFASKLNMTVESENAGKTILNIKIDPEGKVLNVVEGQVVLSGDTSGLDVKVDTASSGLVMWPTPPEYIDTEKTIHFVGGVPNGFNSEISIFKIVLTSSKTGKLTALFKDGASYLNDGLGTKESLSDATVDVKLLKTENSFINNRFIQVTGVIILLLIVLFVFAKYKKQKNEN